jgi:hypothetical protein
MIRVSRREDFARPTRSDSSFPCPDGGLIVLTNLSAERAGQ